MRPRAAFHLADQLTRLCLSASLLLTAAGFSAPPPAPPTPSPASPPAAAPLRLYFPFIASAGAELPPGFSDLMPADVNIVIATRDAAGEHAPVTSAGAAVLFQDQPVAVMAPAGAYTQTVALTLQARPPMDESAALAFTLEARTPQGQLVEQAARPLRLVVDLRSAGLPFGQRWVLAYQDETDPALWHRPEVSVHDAAGLISVETGHFSTWAAGSEPEPWKYAPVLPAASAFSGAATYHYPIALPAGRAGLTPNIDLSYSSRAVDALTISTEKDQGPLGLGWSLAGAEVTRRGVYAHASEGGPVMVYSDLFSLSLGGAAHTLYPAAGADTARDAVVRYYAENGPHLFVERRFDPAAPNQDKLYWIVKTPDGTTYRLGYTADAEAAQTGGVTAVAGHPGAGEATPLRWLADTVTDVFGNQIQYDYENWARPDGTLTTDGVLPAEIRYNFAALAPDPFTRVLGAHASRVVFHATDSHRIRQIQIFHMDQARPVRSLLFGLAGVAYSGAANCGQTSATNTVTSIQEIGADSLSHLPAVSFEYQPLAHYGGCYPYLYLRQVDNGYGGRVRFTYASDGRQEDLHGQDRPPSFGRSYFVTQVETWDGVTPQPALTRYEYTRPCYDNGVQLGALPGAFDCVLHAAGSAPGVAPHLETGGLVGFESATVTILNYGAMRSLQRTVTAFSQDPLTVGQALRAETFGRDGADWALYQESWTEYEAALIAGGPARAARVRLSAATTYNGGEPVTVRAENVRFDDYGNVEESIEYDLAGQPYRRTLNRYAQDTAAGRWLTGALVRQQIFARAGGSWAAEPISETRADFNADGDPATTAPDARGRITASRQWAGGGDFVDTRYTYDAWGHQTTVTTYGEYGTEARYAAADPRMARSEYDAALFGLYPVTQTNPLGHQVVAAYDARLGLPVQVTDPNGAVTAYAYDAFGRLTAIARPGDTLAAPSLRYVYTDGSAPSRTETYQREVSGCAACEHGTVEFYDGLGRVVQTRREAADGRQTVVNTTYDALGRVTVSYLPVLEPAGLSFARPAGWEARPRTYTEFDALGRAVRVIGPDGATALAAYRGPRTAALDPAGRQTVSEADAFGRTVAVYEYQAQALAAPDFGQPADAVTHYTYDGRGALTRVDTLSTTTVITYNTLGQKIGLLDPDLGAWSYVYHPSGELAAQTDARGVTTRFTYDALGRLTGRAFAVPAGVPVRDPGPAAHFYDEGGAAAHALGRRTRLVDSTGTTRWRYDARGRVTAEERLLAGGLGEYTFSYVYDAADRLTALAYPDGEVITTTADTAGRPLSLASSLGQALVTAAEYDAQARLTRLALGNGLTTAYDYYAPAEPLQGGRLRRLSVGDKLLELAYAYDPGGSPIRIEDASRLMAGVQVLHFEYDGLDRLTRAWTTGAALGGYDHAYQYDPLGRLLARTEAGQTHAYSYADPLHFHAATALGAESTYTYDVNGAMTGRVEAGLAYAQTWTADDRLAVVTWDDAGRAYTTTFAYDGDGRRAVRVEDDGRGAVATVYVAGLYERQIDVTGLDLGRLWYAPPAAGAESPWGEWPAPEAGAGRRHPGLARPAEADYSGPGDRTVEQWVPPVYGWEHGHRVPTSAPSCDDKPANPTNGTECGDPPAMYTDEECAGRGAPCYAGEMFTQIGGGYTTTVTYDPATIQATVSCTLGGDGWCINSAALTLLGAEPMPNEAITGIAYSLNSAGTGSHTLNVNPRVLTIGDTAPVTYYFWAESSFGDQSAMGSAAVKVDTLPPAIQRGGPAPGDWDLAGAITLIAVDSGSGPACLRAAWDAWPADDGNCAETSSSAVFPGGGAHTLYVRAWDRAGHQATWSGTYTPDTAPPAFAGPAVTACAVDNTWQSACNAPAFTWPAASDSFSGLAGYEVYWGPSAAGAVGAWTTSPSFTAGAAPEGTRYLRARAQDQAGNWSAWITLFTFRYDLTPPGFAGGATTACAADDAWQGACNAPAFTWPAAADSLSGPAGYEVYWGPSATGAAGSWITSPSFAAGSAPEGTRYLRARARDQAGNWSSWATLFTFRYDATPPVVSASLNGAAGEAGWYRSDVSASLAASDGLSGPALTQYRIDGGAWISYAGPVAVAGDGWRVLEYRAQDQAGNWSSVASQPVNIDLTPPSLMEAAAAEASAQNVLDGAWQNRLADPRFTWVGAADALTGSPTGYRVYWGPDSAGTTPVGETAAAAFDPAGDVPSGVTHFLRVQARDQAGNWSGWRTLFAFAFDNVAPQVTSIWPAEGQILTTSLPVLAATYSDPLSGAGLGTPTLTLDQQLVTPVLSEGALVHTPAAPLAPGPHALLLTVPDQAGNQTLVRRAFWVDAETHLAILTPADGALLNLPGAPFIVEGEPGAAITVTVGGQVYSGRLDAAGRWELTEVQLQPGLNTLSAQAVDSAGNTASHQVAVTVDAGQDVAGVELEHDVVNPQLAPAVFQVTALAGGGRHALSWALELRDAASTQAAVFTGSGPAERQAELWDGKLPSGAWAADGAYTARVVLTTTGGLVTTSPAIPFTLLTTAPLPPSLDCGPEGETWFSQPPALARGTAPAGTQVVIYQDGAPQFLASVHELQWQHLISITAGAPASVMVSARALDAAGNLSAPSPACRLGLSQTDPFTLPHASLSQAVIGLDDTVVLTATTRAVGAPLTAAGVQVSVPAELGAATLERTTVTDAAHTWTGAWQLPDAGLWQAPVTVIFNATDTAVPVANQGAQFVQPYVDLVPPVTRLIWPGEGHRQAEGALTVQGLAEPFSIVTVMAQRQSDGAGFTAEVVAGAAGQWQAAFALPDGVYALTAQARDRAGNLGAASAPVTITVDTDGPVLSGLALAPAFARPGETVSITLDIRDDLSGVAGASAVVADLQQAGESVSVPLAQDGVAYAGMLGVGQAAAEGLKVVQVQAEDGLGNLSSLAGADLIVDARAPQVLTPILATAGPNLIISGTHAIYGPQTMAGLEVTAVVSDDAETHLTAGLEVVNFPAVFGQDGAALTVAGVRAPAAYTHVYTPTGVVSSTFRLEAVDRAGNAADQSFSLSYDSAPPTVTVSAPARSGLRFAVQWAGGDAGAGLAGYDVQIKAPSAPAWTAWFTTTAETELAFIAPASGPYTFRVRATDRVGNVSAWQTAVVEVAAVTKYYLFNGQRLVMRQGAAIYYLHGDHLGSAALVTDAAGGVVSQARYLPYGQERIVAGASPSDFTFTGQRREGFGLLDYNARYYAPALGQFISPDTVIPQPADPQSFNRYGYSLSNPLKYVDPSGHFVQNPCAGKPDCGQENDNGGGFFIPGSPVSPTNNSLTDEQYVSLGVYAESSDGTHPDEAINRMAWVVWNNIANGWDAYEYITTKLCDKAGCSLAGLVAWVLPKGWKWSDLSEGTLRWALTKVFKNHVAYQPFVNVRNIVNQVAQSKATDPIEQNDPTNGSIMFNHASTSPRVPRGWHPEPFANSSALKESLTVNFEKYKRYHPGFGYSLWEYPGDSGLVLVTGNHVCIQGPNSCGANLP